ncbi:MAG: YbaY family lipoprotein [Planctomycetota bacterium]
MIITVTAALFAVQERVLAQDSWGFGIDSSRLYSGRNLSSGWPSQSENWAADTRTNSRWRLGVSGSNTNEGVIVERVTRGSAAERAGILRGDLIVAVGFNRVGIVGRRMIELRDQIDRSVDARGIVEILFQNRRTLQLSSVRIQLDSGRESALTGQLRLPPSVRLPIDAVITIQLANASRPHYAVRNGETSFRPVALTRGAIPFTLNYDRNYVFPSDTYRVRALVTSKGRTVFRTRSQDVLTKGNPVNVTLDLFAVATDRPIASAGGNTLNRQPPNTQPSNSTISYDQINLSVSKAYLRYLDRQPTSLELTAWHHLPDVGSRLSHLPVELMASEEYFDRIGGNNTMWLRRVFQEVNGRAPTASEYNDWTRRFAIARYSRVTFLDQISQL